MDYKKIKVGKFEVGIDAEKQYGYFEHDYYGDELGGGLWFSEDTLVDYDGVVEIPKEVLDGIEKLGFKHEE